MALTRRTLLLSSLSALQPPEPQIEVFTGKLGNISWDTAQRGPLLMVAPEGISWDERQERAAISTSLKTASELATALGYQLVRFPRVSILAPAESEELAQPKEPPTALAARERSGYLSYLLSHLSERQWSQLASDQGLGASELSPELKPALAYILKHAGSGMHRLRLSRTLEISVPSQEPESDPDKPSHSFYSFHPEGPLFSLNDDKERGIVRGPNRLKRSHLDYSSPALSVPTTLENVRTIDELLRRASAATRLPLQADPRLGKLPLWHSPGRHQVPTGELLKALALGVTGTFRKLGNLYLLTNDLEPLLLQLARWEQWWRSCKALLEKEEATEHGQFAGKAKVLRFASGSTLGLPSETLEKVRDSGGAIVSLPWPDVTPEMHKKIEALFADAESARPKRNEPVQLTPTVLISAIGSNGKITPLHALASHEEGADALNEALQPDAEPTEPTPPKGAIPQSPRPWPEKLAYRILLASAKTPDEARALARLARRYGFFKLGLEGSFDALSAALETKALPIALALSPFSTDDPALANRTPWGETSRQALDRLSKLPLAQSGSFQTTKEQGMLAPAQKDWALPAPVALPQLPSGVREVCLLESEPPVDDEYFGNITLTGRLGFTQANRLAFLAKHGADPLDLNLIYPRFLGLRRDEKESEKPLPLHWFPESSSLNQLWNEQRRSEYTVLVEALQTAIKAAGLSVDTQARYFIRSLESDFLGGEMLYLDARGRSVEALEKRLSQLLVPSMLQ